MHNIQVITIIFTSSIILSVHALPTPGVKDSVYDKLLELSNTKCPYLRTTKLLEPKPTFLDSCSNYNTIKSITLLNRTTVDDIPCLFYYNNFALFCNIAGNFNVSGISNTSIDNALKSYKLSDACADLQSVRLIPEFKNAVKIVTEDFRKPRVCEKICSDLISNTLTPICSLAAYSANISMTLQKILDKANQKVKPLPKPLHEIAEEVKPASQAIPVVPADPAQESKPNAIPQLSVHIDQNVEKEAATEKNVEHSTVQKVSPSLTAQIRPNEGSENADELKDNRYGIANSALEDVEVEPPVHDQQKSNVDTSKSNVQKPSGNNSDVPAASSNPTVVPAPKSHQEKSDHPASSSASENVQNSRIPDRSELKPPLSKVTPATKSTTTSSPIAVQESKPDNVPPVAESNEDQPIEPNNQDDIMEEEELIPENTNPKLTEKMKTNTKPQETDEDVMVPAYNNPNTDEEDSFFFIYFMMVCAVFILGYIGYHNKQKVLALVIEGRRGRRGSSRRGRPNSANYHKLDSNLEEAVTSACNKNTTNIIY